jgi:hypothetical protein
MRILNTKKNRHYEAALEIFERADRCLGTTGLEVSPLANAFTVLIATSFKPDDEQERYPRIDDAAPVPRGHRPVTWGGHHHIVVQQLST